MNTIYSKVLEKKKDYPLDIKKQVKMYSINKETGDTRVIGSFSYRSSNASDVDLFESVTEIDKTSLINFFCSGIKKIVNKINETTKQYFLEVKAGLDHLYYDIDFGTCSHNTYIVANNFFTLMEEYYDKGLLNNTEIDYIRTVRNTNKRTQLNYEKIKDLLRKHYILRWTVKDINNGYKILRDLNCNYNYPLELAI
jgi:hypothetical protein